MEKFVEALVVVVLMFVTICVAVILGTLFGALSGVIVGLFFEQTVLNTLAAFGVNTAGVAMWEVGATLGFVGSFFRSSVNKIK